MNLIQCSCMSHERLEFVLYDDMSVISDLTEAVKVIAVLHPPYPPIMLL